VAFRDNGGNLWTAGSAGNTNWHEKVMDGTSPAITGLAGGGYEVAFQDSTGSLWTVGTGGGADNHGNWGLGMAAGLSPAITG